MATAPAARTVPEITHHRAHLNGTTLHYAAAGTAGSPVLLVHGFPETWRAFRKLIIGGVTDLRNPASRPQNQATGPTADSAA